MTKYGQLKFPEKLFFDQREQPYRSLDKIRKTAPKRSLTIFKILEHIAETAISDPKTDAEGLWLKKSEIVDNLSRPALAQRARNSYFCKSISRKK